MTGVDQNTLTLEQEQSSQFSLIHQALSKLGFDWFDYIQRFPSPFTTPRYHHVGTVPDELVRVGKRHLIHDTVISKIMQQQAALIWESTDFYPLYPELAASESEPFYGIFAPGTNLMGNTAAVLTLVRKTHPVTPQELESKGALYRLLIVAVQHLSQLILAARHREQHTPAFTRRQIEILKWVADGKTNEDIAHILGISSHTVNYHNKQILDKTSTQNRHNAAMHAFIAGIIPS